ncbi:hypothetical protein [Thiorhodococcus minor]|uniref:Uncharacterized protein n=1 Tax=Thiorhodococcus minor TaxID=57489 RepID=A0A6M0JVB2_9GAMM|nr:hypothetical protein [Thiorhodococcus minor]NEV60841.1 hypothetical protein [Thiorhodococcus minor]
MGIQPATPELERFVRDSLGCTCPAEVFERVDDSPSELSQAAGIERRIAIGGRLLIYMASVDSCSLAVAKLSDWIQVGISERDAGGMNRLRLVLLMDGRAADEMQRIEAAFERALPDGDERVHLHLLDPVSAFPLQEAHPPKIA